MKSDIEIARSVEMEKIESIAKKMQLDTEQIDHYGKYIAKVPHTLIDEQKVRESNLILVTAITATKAGIGKTTVSVECGIGTQQNRRKCSCSIARTVARPASASRVERPEEDMPKSSRWKKSTFTLPVISMPSHLPTT